MLEDDAVLVEAGSVGYKIFISSAVQGRLREGSEAELYCFPFIREETLALFGVPSPRALRAFEALLGISGVGPKAALALSEFGSLGDLKEALREGRVRVKGLGPKKLQKILLELTGKLEQPRVSKGEDGEEVAALTSLGFSRSEARRALEQVPEEGSPQDRVRQALRVLQSPSS